MKPEHPSLFLVLPLLWGTKRLREEININLLGLPSAATSTLQDALLPHLPKSPRSRGSEVRVVRDRAGGSAAGRAGRKWEFALS